MLYAEKQTKNLRTTPWSPEFQAAVSNKAFWKIALSLKMNYTRPSDAFITWAESKGIGDFKRMDTGLVKSKLREAQKQMREIHKQADRLREQHLSQKLTDAENANETVRQKRLKILLRAHTQQQIFKRLRNMFKATSTGGLSYILIPKDFNAKDYPYEPNKVTEWVQIHDPEIMQELIQKRNIVHFGQAHGTPFTREPLTKLNWEATSIDAREVINGVIPITLLNENQFAGKIINYIAKRDTLPPINTYLTAEQVGRGFRKWRESTSTSPSGCHLGL
jgi:hypothetical protein